MKTSDVFQRGLYQASQWHWQPDGSVIITLVNNKTDSAGKVHYSAKDGKIDQLLDDSEMEVPE